MALYFRNDAARCAEMLPKAKSIISYSESFPFK